MLKTHNTRTFFFFFFSVIGIFRIVLWLNRETEAVSSLNFSGS